MQHQAGKQDQGQCSVLCLSAAAASGAAPGCRHDGTPHALHAHASAAPPVQRCMSLAGNTGVGALLSELKETGQLQPTADGDAAMK